MTDAFLPEVTARRGRRRPTGFSKARRNRFAQLGFQKARQGRFVLLWQGGLIGPLSEDRIQ